MTTYLIDYSATWVGFATLGLGDRLVVAPGGALVLPDQGFDLRGTGAAGVAVAGYAWLDRLIVEGGTSLSVTGELMSDSTEFAIGLGTGALGVIAGQVTAGRGGGVALIGDAAAVQVTGTVAAATGIAVTGRDARVTISGQVLGSDLGVVLGGGAAVLRNAGLIEGGVLVMAEGTLPALVRIENTGTIQGGIGAWLTQGASALVLANAGTIQGNVTTGASADVVTGRGLIEGHLRLGAGNDRFAGRVTGDLEMGTGADTVDARDHAVGGVIRDTGGADLYLVDGAVTIEDSGAGQDRVRAWVDFTLSDGLEVLALQGSALRGTGNAAANLIWGNAGDNRLEGGAGADTLAGGIGDDTLIGGTGADRLWGGEGADVLVGGAGSDVLTGGAGADRFVFGPGPGVDLVTDFGAGDVLDLRAFGPLTLGALGTVGALAISVEGGQTWARIDLDGDGQADAALRLAGVHALTLADLLLQ